MPFDLVATHAAPLLKAELQVFRDRQTGLRHAHLSGNGEHGFLVALPTRPTDNRGGAHVLEHLSLCASGKFPFPAMNEMRQRTAATFLNAETHHDATFHLFSTPVEPDFFNLMDVLIHGAFFPRLDRLDFLQEAWRFQLNPDGQLSLDGVVFNEMQGMLSDPELLYGQDLARVVFAGTSLAQQNGGDPIDLVHLTPEALRDLHAQWAHPAHAVVLTSGPADVALIQERLAAWLQVRAWPAPPPLFPQICTLDHTPRLVFPVAAQDDEPRSHRLTRSWLLDVPDSPARTEADVVATLLIGEGGALGKVLDDPNLGRRGGCGLLTQPTATAFQVSIDGLSPDGPEQAEDALDRCLVRLAQEGVRPARIDAAFQSLETDARKQADDEDKPFVLTLMGNVADVLLNGGSLEGVLDPLAALAAARRTVGTPSQVAAWIGRHLCDNPRGVVAVGVPDSGLLARRTHALDAFVAQRQASLTEHDRGALLDDQRALEERVGKAIPADALPSLSPNDLRQPPPAFPMPLVQQTPSGATRVDVPVETHGLVGFHLGLDLSDAPSALHGWLKLAFELSFELGVGTMNHAATERWRSRSGQDFASSLAPWLMWNNAQQGGLHGVLEGWGMARNAQGLAEVLVGTWRQAQPDPKRVRRLMAQKAPALLQDLVAMADDFALDRCMAHLDPARARQDALMGRDGVVFLRGAATRLKQGGEAAEGVHRSLSEAFDFLRAAPVFAQTVADAPDALSRVFAGAIGACVGAELHPRPWAIEALPAPAQTAWTAEVDVHDCWQVFSAPLFGHPDAPACEVLTKVLTHDFLIPWLREQGGAYDGCSVFRKGALMFRAFRSPRLGGAYADIARALERAAAHLFPMPSVERGILSAVRDFDIDQRARGGALADLAWQAACTGLTHEARRTHREAMLAVTAADLRRVAQTWLQDVPSSRVAVVSGARADEALRLGLVVEPLLPPAGHDAPRRKPRP